MQLLELPEDHGQDAPAGPGRSTDLEPALELTLGFVTEVREQLLLERKQPLRSAVEPEPGLGRLDPTAGAVEEPLTDALFERPDLKADRGLRRVHKSTGNYALDARKRQRLAPLLRCRKHEKSL